jgi:protein phosphatase
MSTSLYCVNRNCQHPNKIADNFCTKCGTPLTKRYLWGLSDQLINKDEIISDRYLIINPGVLLDTKPAQPPETTEEIPAQLIPYLKLFPQRLHIPQVYGFVNDLRYTTIWLLEEAAIAQAGIYAPHEGKILPSLSKSWEKASSLRQLNWLWQIVKLWDLMNNQGVAQTLLNIDLIRVEGSLIKLWYLLPPQKENLPTLIELGQVWQQLIPMTNTNIKDFFVSICEGLIKAQITTGEHLLSILDEAISGIANNLKYSYNIVTFTDKGPTRGRNEDNCYPDHNKSGENLAIVCDGIGGHEGGDLASKMAIDTLVEQVNKIINPPSNNSGQTVLQITPQDIRTQLEKAVKLANDQISERNDSENRNDRQRMGTTVVMGLGQKHELYITHVGDSRVYRITKTNCHQITLDDDISSREVRLGYYLYRDALQHAAGGALIQALGMNVSTNLHPTVQRFIVDEESIYLLCSDGLSEFERVDQHWENKLLPLLEKKANIDDLKKVAKELVLKIANEKNGHDNATVAIMYCQIEGHDWASELIAPAVEKPPTTAGILPLVTPPPAPNNYPTLIQPSPMPGPNIPTGEKNFLNKLRSPLGIGVIFGILLLTGGLVFGLYKMRNQLLTTPQPETTETPKEKSAEVKDQSVKEFNKGTVLSFKVAAELSKINPKTSLIVPADTIMEILQVHPKAKKENFLVELQVCQNPNVTEETNNNTDVKKEIKKGDNLVISEANLEQYKEDFALESSDKKCSKITTSAQNTSANNLPQKAEWKLTIKKPLQSDKDQEGKTPETPETPPKTQE